MARLSDALYDFLEANLTIPEIYESFVEKDVIVDDGALTFQRLPSPASNNITGTSLNKFQFSIRHSNQGIAQDYRQELVDLLLDWSGDLSTDFRQVVFFMEADLGEVQEDDTQLWVLTDIFNIKYIR